MRNIFSKGDKRNFVVIMNNDGTVLRDLEIPFPSSVILIKVLFTDYSSLRNEMSKKQNMNRKTPHMFFNPYL